MRDTGKLSEIVREMTQFNIIILRVSKLDGLDVIDFSQIVSQHSAQEGEMILT